MALPITPMLVGTLDLSAASGVVARAGELVVAADDGVRLVRFDRRGFRLGAIDLGLPELPEEPKLRKRKKPDFEALTLVDADVSFALGSGSTEARRLGKRVDLRTGSVADVDLAPLYLAIQDQFAELNIEGAALHGEHLVLAQRGNGRANASALVLLDRARALDALAEGVLDASLVVAVRTVDLGLLDEVPLAPTDLAVDARGRLWFSAAAEDTKSTYDDGPCRGSIVGFFDADYGVAGAARIDGTVKVEGLCFEGEAHAEEAFLVADPDDPTLRAPLYRFTF